MTDAWKRTIFIVLSITFCLMNGFLSLQELLSQIELLDKLVSGRSLLKRQRSIGEKFKKFKLQTRNTLMGEQITVAKVKIG